jgi:tetratricopeptide (TPR) repeat protein
MTTEKDRSAVREDVLNSQKEVKILYKTLDRRRLHPRLTIDTWYESCSTSHNNHFQPLGGFAMRLYLLLLCLITPVFATEPLKPLVPESEIMALNDEMRKFVDEHLGHIASREVLLQKLIWLMFDEDGLNIQYEGGITKTAVEVFETGKGNCLGFTNLFIALAREVGLNAKYQQVYNIPQWGRQNHVVIQNRHVNARVWIDNIPYTVDFYPDRNKREFHQRVLRDNEAMAQFYNNLGVEAFAEHQFHYAKANFDRALQHHDGISFIWTNYGALQRNMGDFEDAEKSYKRALRLNRFEYAAMINLAKLYRAMDKEEKAERWEERSQRHMRRNPYYHFFLGEESYLAGDYEGAAVHYRRAIQRNDRDHELHFALARTYYRLGDAEKAEAELRRAHELADRETDAKRYSQKLATLLASH